MPAAILVVVPHEPDQCLDAVEATINQGPGFQEGYEWGCLVRQPHRFNSSCAPAGERGHRRLCAGVLPAGRGLPGTKIRARDLRDLRDREAERER